MLKLLRKYNKVILAVGGTLLMIVFLLPQGFQSFGHSASSFQVAVADGRSVTEGQLSEAEKELRALKNLDSRTANSLGRSVVLPLLGLQREPNREHWWLLTEEARRGGFIGGVGDADEFLRQLAEVITSLFAQRGMPPDRLAEFLSITRSQLLGIRDELAPTQHDRDLLNLALSKAAGVLRMYDLHMAVASVTTSEAIELGRQLRDSAQIEFAVIDATTDLAGLPTPTDEQVRAQFEKHKNNLREDDPRGFGYATAAAIKYATFQISRKAIESSLKLDPVQVRVHWERNKSRFNADFAIARAEVEKEMKAAQVDAIIGDAERFVQTEVLKAERGLAPDGRFKKLPDDWESARPNFSVIQRSLFDHLRTKHGIGAQVTMATERTIWVPEGVLRDMGDVASTFVVVPGQGRRAPFAEWAFAVRELNPDAPFGGQVGLVVGPLRSGPASDVYFARIDAARPQIPGTDLEPLRGTVEGDVLKIAAFERLVGRSDEIRAKAAENFETGVMSIAGGVRIDKDARVNRSGITLSDGTPAGTNFNTEAVRSAVMAVADKLDPTVPAESIPAIERTLVVPLPDWFSVGVIRITGVRPLSVEDFRMVSEILAQRAPGELRRSEAWAFSYDNMIARHGFQLVGAARKAHEKRQQEQAAEKAAAEKALLGGS